jgi:hypothetical protein
MLHSGPGHNSVLKISMRPCATAVANKRVNAVLRPAVNCRGATPTSAHRRHAAPAPLVAQAPAGLAGAGPGLRAACVGGAPWRRRGPRATPTAAQAAAARPPRGCRAAASAPQSRSALRNREGAAARSMPHTARQTHMRSSGRFFGCDRQQVSRTPPADEPAPSHTERKPEGKAANAYAKAHSEEARRYSSKRVRQGTAPLACRRSERRGPSCSPWSSGPSVTDVSSEFCKQRDSGGGGEAWVGGLTDK